MTQTLKQKTRSQIKQWTVQVPRQGTIMPDVMTLVDARVPESCLLFRVLDYCDIQSIRSICRTCTLLSAVVDVYETEAWCPNRFFENWFPSSDNFRSILRDSDAIVYGSAVLRYLERSQLPKFMNIIVGIEGLLMLGNWIERSGYEFTSSSINSVVQASNPPTLNFHDTHQQIAIQGHKKPIRHTFGRSSHIHFRKRSDTRITIRLTIAREDPFLEILNANTSTDTTISRFPLILTFFVWAQRLK